jgi:hypothetical protein
MADKKISALTGASTPLAGTEVLPIVQSGSTVKVAVSDLTAGRATSVLSLTSTNDSTVNGVTVGKGAGSVASNTSLGASALAGNSTGSRMTAVGYRSMVGATGSNNAAFGSNTFESLTSGTNGTAIGDYALQQTTGSFNTAVGNGSGYLITTGSKNTILGIYSGNQNGLNITTSSNYVVLSDGDGTPRAYHNGTDWVYPTGNLVIGTSGNGLTSTGTITCKSSSAGTDWAVYSSSSSVNPAYFINGSGTVNGIGTGANGAASAMYVNRDTGSLRSINAAGSLNALGADYAEYMVKDGDFVFAKGDICGIKANGKLTNVFADAVSFVVKSTDPSYVGGDTWFNEQAPQPPVELTVLNENATDEEKAKYEFDLITYNSDLATYIADLASWKQRLEVARAPVDRIAFCGLVPVNVQGATPGQFIVPTDDNGAIKGVAVSNPTFEQYQAAVGKVIAVEADGRAKIIVKIA